MMRDEVHKRKYSLLRFLLYLAVLTEMCFFYLFSLSGALGTYVSLWNKTGVFFIVFIAMVYLLMKKGKRIAVAHITPMVTIVSILAFGAFIEAMFTLAVYPDVSLSSVAGLFFLYCIPTIAVAFFEVFRADGGLDRLMDGITWICLVYVILYIGDALVYNVTGTLVIPGMMNGNSNLLEVTSQVYERSMGIRLYALPSLVPITGLYSFVRCFWDKPPRGKKLLYFVSFALTLVAFIYVNQSRIALIALIVSALIALVFCKMTGRSWLKNTIFVLVVIIAIYESGYVSTLLGSFTDVENAGSSIARNYSLNYFFGVFTQSPLSGYGFIEGTTSLSYIYHGPAGIAYTSDIGFVGQLGQWGLLFAIPYCLIVIRMAYVMFKGWASMRQGSRALVLSLFVYVLATTPTLIMFDAARILVCPVVMAITEYIYATEHVQTLPQVKISKANSTISSIR